MYQLFYDSEEPPKFPKRNTSDQVAWGSSGKDARLLSRFRGFFGKTNEADRKILLSMARKIAGSSRARP